ncbi:MAG TPA: methionyl-tRNA formyltransferase [Acidiferrobacteraceae bacterium]|nr:methionyl-tRNA formyltransferase [Acidiferrobacteraceae bacterium]
MSLLRVVFAGTPEFALPTLQALHREHQLIQVWTRPDRPAGRGQTLRESAVKTVARTLGVDIRQPLRADLSGLLAETTPDLLVVVAFGMLLPVAVLDWPRLGALNVHASLLPRWRGAAPIARAIEAGDTQTGISIMRMDAGLDTGPIYLQRSLDLMGGVTAGEAHDALAQAGAEALLESLPLVLAGREPQRQPETGACYAPKLQKHEAWLNWSEDARVLERRIRAFHPYPVAQTRCDTRVLRIHKAECRDLAAGAPPGTIVALDAQGIDVATGHGMLRLRTVQPQGGRVMSAPEFARGQRLQLGQRLVSA